MEFGQYLSGLSQAGGVDRHGYEDLIKCIPGPPETLNDSRF